MSTIPSWLTDDEITTILATEALAVPAEPAAEPIVVPVDVEPEHDFAEDLADLDTPTLEDREDLTSDDEFLAVPPYDLSVSEANECGCSSCEAHIRTVFGERIPPQPEPTFTITKKDLYAIEDVLWSFETLLENLEGVGMNPGRGDEFSKQITTLNAVIAGAYKQQR